MAALLDRAVSQVLFLQLVHCVPEQGRGGTSTDRHPGPPGWSLLSLLRSLTYPHLSQQAKPHGPVPALTPVSAFHVSMFLSRLTSGPTITADIAPL
jgi:hypothetical protein